MSWEQYFTDLLIETTRESDYMKYNKSNLSDFYIQDKNVADITKIAKGIKWQYRFCSKDELNQRKE